MRDLLWSSSSKDQSDRGRGTSTGTKEERSRAVKMKIKLPADVLFHHDLRLMVWRPCGLLNEKRVKTIVAFLEAAEERADKPFNRFADLSKLAAIDLNFHFVFHVSLHRRLVYEKHPPVKSAFYVTHPQAAQLVKIHAIMTGHSPLQVAMFEDLAEAAEWLGVSKESLEY